MGLPWRSRPASIPVPLTRAHVDHACRHCGMMGSSPIAASPPAARHCRTTELRPHDVDAAATAADDHAVSTPPVAGHRRR